jgi:hypothetical protein
VPSSVIGPGFGATILTISGWPAGESMAANIVARQASSVELRQGNR